MCQGDTVIVNVLNQLRPSDLTSIHWHGVHMKHTPNMDGVGFITQYPIFKNSYYQYKYFFVGFFSNF